MADESVNIYDPLTGTQGAIPAAAQVRAQEATGARKLSQAESVAALKKQALDRDTTGALIAHNVGEVRGLGESVGIPTDVAIPGVASLFGKGEETKAYLRKLQEEHPTASAVGGVRGQIGGAVLASEFLGPAGAETAAARAPTALARVGQAAGRTAVQGGLENLVAGTTHDINESALGDPDLAGQKIFANMPKHFATGFVAGGLLGGAGGAVGEGVSALSRKGAPALDSAASPAIGRELGETGEAATSTGAQVRAATFGQTGRTVPRSSSEVADILAKEQAGLRARSSAEYGETMGGLERAHTEEAGRLSMAQEGSRKAGMAAGAASVRDAEMRAGGSLQEAMAAAGQRVEQVTDHYAGRRAALAAEREQAESLASKLAEERTSNATQLETAVKKMKGDAPAQEPSIDEILGIMGRKRDPATRWAVENSLAEHGSVLAESTTNEASKLHVERLTELSKSLTKAHLDAVSHLKAVDSSVTELDAEAAKNIAAVGRQADREVAALQASLGKETAATGKEAEGNISKFERAADKERGALEKGQAAERAGVPKPSKETAVDPLIAKAQASAAAHANRPAVSPSAVMGSLLSLAHGNVPAAGLAIGGSLLAGRMRGETNYVAARSLRYLAEQLTKVDAAIQRGAMNAVGHGASKAAAATLEATSIRPSKGSMRAPSFEQSVEHVKRAAGNPSLVTAEVEQRMGHWAADAPQVYGSVLASAQRAQAFLEARIPQSRADPHSLTPHLESGEVSPTEKYDFMQYVKTLSDPKKVFDDVRTGAIDDDQVEAIQTVYPGLFKQMQTELQGQVISLDKPLPYEHSIHVGTLLGVITDDVLEPDFQSLLQQNYKSKSKQNAPVGSKSSSAESKVGKDMQSASESVERGD